MKAILFYVHDPMCSWCWGFSRTLGELLENLPAEIEVHRLLGGLAADTDLPMPDSMQQHIKSNWARIEDTFGQKHRHGDRLILHVEQLSRHVYREKKMMF